MHQLVAGDLLDLTVHIVLLDEYALADARVARLDEAGRLDPDHAPPAVLLRPTTGYLPEPAGAPAPERQGGTQQDTPMPGGRVERGVQPRGHHVDAQVLGCSKPPALVDEPGAFLTRLADEVRRLALLWVEEQRQTV